MKNHDDLNYMLGVVVHASNPSSTQETIQPDLCMLYARLVYTVSSRSVRASYRDFASGTMTKKKQTQDELDL